MSYEVKDSGVRQVFDSGMVRDVSEDKTDYTLALDGPMFDRWAEHLTAGARKYDARNWMKASGEAEYERFKQSALRHFLQWFRGENDEDHASAVFFNINGAEYVAADATAYSGPEVWGCDGCYGCEFCGPSVQTPVMEVNATAKVGDVDANDILDAISQPGGAGDLAEDYNYLRNRVQDLSDQLNRGVVDENDPYFYEPNFFFDELLGG